MTAAKAAPAIPAALIESLMSGYRPDGRKRPAQTDHQSLRGARCKPRWKFISGTVKTAAWSIPTATPAMPLLKRKRSQAI